MQINIYADVAGYSRLTGSDEDGTHRVLSAHLDLLTASIQDHGGRVVHFAGDAVLADFATVSSALTCAMAAQVALATRNEELPELRKVRFRIGVNLGEVIIDRDDIYGDGVNVAARLEGLAEPGGICLSETVFDAIGQKLPVDYHFLGEQRVKNIAKPIRAYHAQLQPGAVLPPPAPTLRRPRRFPRRAAVASALVALVVAAAAVWTGVAQRDTTPAPQPKQNELESSGERLSVAVLPFDNLSRDPAQDFFADGMTSDLITDLSKVSGLLVIARHSVFAYKGRPAAMTDVAQELGVRYLVEGSVQRVRGRIRINAQLIDTATGGHLWAERYESAELDIFTVQDKVVADIVAALAVRLTDAERTRLGRQHTDSLEAYDNYLRAEALRLDGNDERALELYRQAVALDPGYVDAYAGLARSALEIWRWDSTDVMPGPVARKLAYDAAGKVLSLDDSDPRAYAVLALIQATDGEHGQAVESARKAVTLDPSNAFAFVAFARILVYAGRHADALGRMETAFRLNPKPPA